MSTGTAPGLRQEKARRILLHLLGGGDLRAALWVLALLVGLGWFTDSLFEWLADAGRALSGEPVRDWLPLHRVVAVVLFGLMLVRLAWLAAGARQRYRALVAREDRPAQTKGLVLFLSNLRVNQERGQDEPKALRAGLAEIDGIDAFREAFGMLNWRMPLEAIAYHLPRLEQVIVICSSGTGGSARQFSLFKALCGRVFPDAAFRLIDAAELDSRFSGGLAFEDVDAVSRATDQSFQRLLDDGLPLSDILIDITGGQKPNAVAATAVALAEGRRIEYVTFDYRVTVYDVTYEQ